MNGLIFAAIGATLATGAQAQGHITAETPKGQIFCPCTISQTDCAKIGGVRECLTSDMNALIEAVHIPICDPGWTLVPVATGQYNLNTFSPGTKQLCAPVGELKEPK